MTEKTYLAGNPQIEQIRLGNKMYDIKTTKDWAENDDSTIGYIQNRTHNFYYRTGSDCYIKYDQDGKPEFNDDGIIYNEISDTRVSYQFSNQYDFSDIRIHQDYWYPGLSWLEEGKPYNLKITPSKGAEATELKEVPLTDGIICYGQKGTEANEAVDGEPESTTKDVTWTLQYNSADKSFCLTGEDFAKDSTTGLITTNGFTLEIAPSNVNDVEYTFVNQLDARFLPLDNESIHVNEFGKLTVDDVFTKDLKVSQKFGQYNPADMVPANQKSVKEVILDAYCKDINPTNNSSPKIESFEISATTPADQNGYYEVGKTIEFNWDVVFDPGQYEFGLGKATKIHKNSTSDIIITGHEGKIAGSPSVEFGTFDKKCFRTSTNRDPYTTIGWGVRNRFARANGKESIILPHTPQHSPLQAKFKVSFDHVEGDEADKQYLPCTLFQVPIKSSEITNTCFHEITNKICNYEIDTFKCDYRWFWGYETSGTLGSVLAKIIENKAWNRRQDLPNMRNQLGGFDRFITTEKMTRLYFLAPTHDFSSLNIKSKDGGQPKYKKIYQEVKVLDAGGNEQDYTLIILYNDEADFSTHTYAISYTKGGTN